MALVGFFGVQRTGTYENHWGVILTCGMAGIFVTAAITMISGMVKLIMQIMPF